MKKILCIILSFFAVAVIAQAQAYYGNGTSSDESYFTTNVVTPITTLLSSPTLDLPPVVPGYPRAFSPAKEITITINGEPNRAITVAGATLAPAGGVTITGQWDTPPAAFDGDGKAVLRWTCSQVAAASGATHGIHPFTLNVDVHYTSI